MLIVVDLFLSEVFYMTKNNDPFKSTNRIKNQLLWENNIYCINSLITML